MKEYFTGDIIEVDGIKKVVTKDTTVQNIIEFFIMRI